MHPLIVTEQGARLHVEADQILIQRERHVLRRIRLADIDQILLCGRIDITQAVIALVCRRGIDLVWLTQDGRFRARLITRQSRNSPLRLAQYARVSDPSFSVQVAARIVSFKIRHQREILLRAQRKLKDNDIAQALARMRRLAEQAPQTASLESLRGIEGQAAALYFGQFGKLLKASGFDFQTRSRRPPRDPVNACLSFGYAVLGSIVEHEVNRAGLDPLLGFFHQPLAGRPSLMLDLLEEFRPFVDTLTLRLVNRRQLAPGDFERRTSRSVEDLLAASDEAAGADLAAGQLPSEELLPLDDDPWDFDEAVSPQPRSPVPDASPPTAVASEPAEPVMGVFLGPVGRRVFLSGLFGRLRESLYYPPRQGSYELRDIIREQAYHLARVIEGRDVGYQPFVPNISPPE